MKDPGGNQYARASVEDFVEGDISTDPWEGIDTSIKSSEHDLFLSYRTLVDIGGHIESRGSGSSEGASGEQKFRAVYDREKRGAPNTLKLQYLQVAKGGI